MVKLIGLIATLMIVGNSSNSIASEALVKGIDATAMANGQVEVRIEFDGNVPENLGSFTIDNPARLSIDIPNSKLSVDKRIIPIELGVVNSARLLQSGNRSRVVINLSRVVPYNIRTADNTIFVQLNTGLEQFAQTEKQTISSSQTSEK